MRDVDQVGRHSQSLLQISDTAKEARAVPAPRWKPPAAAFRSGLHLHPVRASIREIAQRVDESVRLTLAAVDRARETDAVIGELAVSASRINDITRIIQQIAEQTTSWRSTPPSRRHARGRPARLLGGGHRGEVAGQQTANATQQIGAQIGAMEQAVSGAAEFIRQISDQVERPSRAM